MKKDVPATAVRIAAPDASVKRKKKKHFFILSEIKATRGHDFYQHFSR